MASDKKPTIHELEAILDDPDVGKVEVQPDGSVKTVKLSNDPLAIAKRFVLWLTGGIACPVHGWPERRTATGNKGCWKCRK